MKKFNTGPSEFAHPQIAFPHLSLRDLMEAQQKYHADLLQHPNVVATAVGRYRIRVRDSWPNEHGAGKVHGSYARTLSNSEIRPYSWPAILVFVDEWQTEAQLAKGRNGLGAVPKSYFLSDQRAVPVCVIEAPKESKSEIEARDIRYPLNNIGGGNPVLANVQGRQYAATVGCLVGDGHKVYALTNSHVAGEAGEVICSRLGGRDLRVGISSGIRLKKSKFSELYPGWPGDDVSVNLDVGLIELDDINQWTAKVGGTETLGQMVDMPLANALSLVGCPVRGIGAASGEMLGEIHALFYRYNTRSGTDYVADLLIGPRVSGLSKTKSKSVTFATHPGDSGSLWVIDETDKKTGEPNPLPLALQWGRNMFSSAGKAAPQSFALATFLGKVCSELDVDPIRDWNLDQSDTWGAVGHYSIAAKSANALSSRFPKLVKLMNNNALIISHDDQTILNSDFKGMGSEAFVALADVPDFFWKPRIGKQGFTRAMEGPNHFADMDQPDSDGKTLLDLCQDPAFIDAAKWNDFYSSVTDQLDGKKIAAVHRGLLPFRVWQIFDWMVEFVSAGKAKEFVCAAGVLTHYIGDACQPLHISYLHDGDPARKYKYTYQSGQHAGESEWRPLGNGVHSAYEDEMVNANRDKILTALGSPPKATKAEKIDNGYEAAQRTIDMMRATFTMLPPMNIVNAFHAYTGKTRHRAAYMWTKFGDDTIKSMQSGAHLLAVLWESAWDLGDGESNIASTQAISESDAMKTCGKPDFLPSMSVAKVGDVLKQP